jgi:chromosome partitioning protein
MKIAAICASKGGAGKSLISIHLAVAAELAGFSAILFDADPQGTAERWSEWRQEFRNTDAPAVIGAKASTMARRVEQARQGGADLVVIDTPPLAQAEAREAATLADLILIPCRPSAVDLDAIRMTAALAVSTGKPTFAVMNAGHPASSQIYAEAEAVMKRIGIGMSPAWLSDRVAFRRSIGEGASAQETEPDSKAAEEVAKLYKWVADQLGLAKGKGRKAA